MDSSWAYGFGPRSESGLEALSEWLSSAMRRHKGTRWGVWGGLVGGTSGIAGGATGALAGTHAPVWEFFLPWTVWLAWSCAVTIWLVRSLRSEEDAELSGRETSRVITMLANARARGKLRSSIGDDYATHLNEGARLALRCRHLLDTPSMRLAMETGTWARAAENARNAVDAGMIRLLVLATRHGDETEIRETLDQMGQLADELAEVERRHSAIFVAQGAKTDSLRNSLAELKELSQAEEEAVSELRLGGRS